MSARDVAFTLMALGHVAGCRGKTATEILAEAVGEIVRLQTALDKIAHTPAFNRTELQMQRTAREALESKEGRDEQI